MKTADKLSEAQEAVEAVLGQTVRPGAYADERGGDKTHRVVFGQMGGKLAVAVKQKNQDGQYLEIFRMQAVDLCWAGRLITTTLDGYDIRIAKAGGGIAINSNNYTFQFAGIVGGGSSVAAGAGNGR